MSADHQLMTDTKCSFGCQGAAQDRDVPHTAVMLTRRRSRSRASLAHSWKCKEQTGNKVAIESLG